jgi:hypothetical protein
MKTNVSFYFPGKFRWRIILIYIFTVVFSSQIFTQQGILASKVNFTIDPNGKMEVWDSTVYYHHTLKDYFINGLEVNSSTWFRPDFVSTPDSFIVYSAATGTPYDRTINYIDNKNNVVKQQISKYNGMEWIEYSEEVKQYDLNNNLIRDSIHIFNNSVDINYIRDYSYRNNKVITEYYSIIDGIKNLPSRLVDSINNSNHVHYWYYRNQADTLFLSYENISEFNGSLLISNLDIQYGQLTTYKKRIYTYQQDRLVNDTLFSSINPSLGYDVWYINNYYYNTDGLIDHIDIVSGIPLKVNSKTHFIYDSNKKLIHVSEEDLTNRADSFEIVRTYEWTGDDITEFTLKGYDLSTNKYSYSNDNYRYHYTKNNVGTKSGFNKNAINVFPNPFSDYLEVEGIESENVLSISLKTINGILVKKIDIKEIASGILVPKNLYSGYYLLEILTKTGNFKNKLIKI